MKNSEAAVAAATTVDVVADAAMATVAATDEEDSTALTTIANGICNETAGDADVSPSVVDDATNAAIVTNTVDVSENNVEESMQGSTKEVLSSTVLPVKENDENIISNEVTEDATGEVNNEPEVCTTLESDSTSKVDAAVSSPHTTQIECATQSTVSEQQQKDSELCTSNMNASTSEGLADSLPVVDSKRKFRVLGLCFPGKWMENKAFLDILHKSETFHLWFEKSCEGKVKPGGASIVFESIAEAKNAFAEVQQLKIDGCTIKLQASKLFYEDSTSTDGIQGLEKVTIPFNLTAAVDQSTYKLYAVHLPSSTNKDLLDTLFDKDYVKNVHLVTDPYATKEMQAEIIFWSKDQADIALSEIIDVGLEEMNRMELLNTNEYIAYMKKAAAKGASPQQQNVSTFAASPSGSTPVAPVHVPLVPAPNLSVDDVAGFLEKYVEKTRTNWAELNDVSELWKLCDNVSREHDGIPDSLLKEALLIVLENHRNSNEGSWWKKSVDVLIESWKKEVQNAKSAPREGAVSMNAPTYSPPEIRKRRNRRNKSSLSTLMGVGALLNTARTTLAVEEGEVDVSEDEHGIFSVNGQELTFEYWGGLYKASSANEGQKQLPISRDYWKLRYMRKKEMREKKMEEQKIKMMQESMKPLEGELNEETAAVDDTVKESALGPSAAETTENVKKRELEEGEMSSETSSSSSASSSSDESTSSARNRRRKRRRHKKNNVGIQIPGAGANPQFTQILTWLYEQRHRLVRSLQPSQKTTFAAVLNQIASSPHGMTSAQQSEMNAFMRDYATNSFPSK